MRLIGSGFTKIEGKRSKEYKPSQELPTNIEFLNMSKEKISNLADLEAIKIEYEFSIEYDKETKGQTGVFLEGFLVLQSDPDEAKKIMKAWKKKAIPNDLKINLFNIILNKCSLKALQIEEELALPLHVAMPRVEKPSSS